MFLLVHVEYVEELLTKLWAIAEDSKCARRKIPEVNSPPPLSSAYEHPVKNQAIEEHKSRFIK